MKKSLMASVFVIALLALSNCSSAYGMAFFCSVNGNCNGTKHTPEIDPGFAVSGVALLTGSLAVMRAPRKKSK